VFLSTAGRAGPLIQPRTGKTGAAGRDSGPTLNEIQETTMLKKPLVIAAIAVAATAVLAPTDASAGDPGLGALLGGAVGAAIGHNVNGHNGAVVGGVLGAITGASIAASSGGYYYGPGYAAPPATYYPPAPVYYAPPVYYRPARAYYAPPMVVRPRPVYVHNGAPMRPVYATVVVERRHDWRRDGPYRR
jgi:hypothetical protein